MNASTFDFTWLATIRGVSNAALAQPHERAEGTGAPLFLGYFDQTDVFFKMARVLSSNTKQLDKSLEQKMKDDVAPVRTGKGILEP